MSASRSAAACVAALVDEDRLPAAVDEHGRGVVRGDLQRARDPLRRVLVGRVGDREVVRGSVAAAAGLSPALTPEEGDRLAALGRHALEDRELRPARAAPRGPLVDHDGMAAQRAQPRVERVGPALAAARGLGVQRGERSGALPPAPAWRPRGRSRGVLARRVLRSAPARRVRPSRLRQPDDQHGDEGGDGEQRQGATSSPSRVAHRCSPPVRLLQWTHSRAGDSEAGQRSNTPLDVVLARLSPVVRFSPRRPSLPRTSAPSLAESTSVAVWPRTVPTSADLERAATFTREPFVLRGRGRRGRARAGQRRAASRSTPRWPSSTPARASPSIEWRRAFSLLLGLERLLERGGAPARRRHGALRPPGRRALGHADRAAGRGPAQRQRQRQRLRGGRRASRRSPPPGSPARRPATRTRRTTSPRSRRTGARTVDEDDAQLAEQPEDPNAAKRFWFEHATGAGKTVAALGFVEASRTGGVLILTHRRNLVDQFHGELRDRGYAKRISPALLRRPGPRRRPGHRRDLPVVRAQRGQDLRRLHDRHLRRGPHRAGREDLRGDPPVGRPDLRRHDRDGRADRPPRHRPLPDADVALRPRPGRAPRRHLAAALRAHPARARACARSPRCRCAAARSTSEFDQEMLAELLDQLPFNLAIADLYKTRFNGVPGVVYAAGVRHAYNVAEAFRDLGHEGAGRLGRDAQARAGRDPRRATSAATIDVLVNAQLLAEGWNSPRATVCMHLAPTASKRIYQQRVGRVTRRHPGKEAGIVVDFVHPGDQARRPGRDAALAARPRRLPRRRDRRRPGAPRPRPPAARRAPRAPGHRRREPADRGLRARAVADRRRAPRLRRADPVGRARRRPRGARRAGAAPARCCTSTRAASSSAPSC